MADVKSPTQFLLAGHLLARPELVNQLRLRADQFDSQAAAFVVETIYHQGSAFANPLALIEAATESKREIDPSDLHRIIDLIPDDTGHETVSDLMFKVRKEVAGRQATAEYSKIYKRLEAGEVSLQEALVLTNGLAEDYRSGGEIRDTSGRGILERAKDATPKVRWKYGLREIDMGFRGIDKDGEPVQALFAQKEVTMTSAAYKSRKTTFALGGAVAILDQGGSVLYLMLEDDDVTATLKLMAAKFDIEFWKLEYWLMGKEWEVIAERRAADLAKIEAAHAWFLTVQDRWFVLDASNAEYNVYSWESLKDAIYAYKAKHNVTQVVLDYTQLLSSDYEILAVIARESRAVAARADVSFHMLSQQSNESQKNGSKAAYFSTKGSGDFGANVHTGIELTKQQDEAFVEVWLKITRNNQPRKVYFEYSPATGFVLDVQDFYIKEDEVAKPAPRKKGK